MLIGSGNSKLAIKTSSVILVEPCLSVNCFLAHVLESLQSLADITVQAIPGGMVRIFIR